MILLKNAQSDALRADSGEYAAGGFALRCVAAALVCFVASFGKMVGFPSYINVACAVISGRYSGAALFGALISYAVQGKIVESAVQLAAITVTAAINIFFPYYSKNGDPVRLSLFTAACCLLLSCVISAAAPDSFCVTMRILSSLLCACAVYAAAFICEKTRCGEPIRIKGLTAVYVAMLYITAIATLSSCQIGIFNIGRIVSCAVIPAAAKKRRASGGAVMGAITSVSVTLCSSALSQNTLLLAAAGLICSAFCDFGRIAVGLAFMLSASAALATSGLNADTFNMLADITVGTAIFVAVPKTFTMKLMSKFTLICSPADSAGQTASSRLTFASMTIGDIRDKLALVSDTVEARSQKLTLRQRVREKACMQCRLYDECVKNGRCERVEKICTSQNFEEISVAGCIRSAELSQITALCREQLLDDRAEAARLKEMRLFLREQLSTVSDILNDLSYRLARKRAVDSELSASAKAYFERRGFRGVHACVYSDESCRCRAEVYLSGEFDEEPAAVTAGLCRVLECDLELPGITSANKITKLEFDEIPPFRADFGCYTALGTASSCSGDSLESVECSAGEKYFLLSDGMGTGKRARLDSAMAVNLAGRMLRSGLSMTTAQRVINSVMRVKDWEESFATLDFVRLDLFSGRAEFLKSGAAPAYLCRDGAIVKINCESYPTGILSSCDPDVCSCKLFDGDVLVLASDGAPESALKKIPETIAAYASDCADNLAFTLGSLCMAEAAGEKQDDITLAVIKISLKKSSVCV